MRACIIIYLFYYYVSHMIIGTYSSKEEIQLKAPTDLSLFERLKGSLKSFLSRHMNPQVC